MKYSRILLYACLLLASTDALARTARETFDRLTGCIAHEDTAGCRALITSRSVGLYDRFASYGLLKCLPKDAAFQSQTRKDRGVIIRASMVNNGRTRTARLVFMQEAGQWKLDAPESLHMGMGDNWEQQVNLTEQIYLMMKQNMGGQLNCDAIRQFGGSRF